MKWGKEGGYLFPKGSTTNVGISSSPGKSVVAGAEFFSSPSNNSSVAVKTEAKIEQEGGAIVKTASLNKEANQGAANVQSTPSWFYSPELTQESWLLPKTRQELLKWTFLADTKLYTRDGTVKSIKDVEVGEEILSSKKNGLQKVVDKCHREWTGTSVTIKPLGLPATVVTDYHPVLAIRRETYDKTRPMKDQMQWVSADLLQLSDWVVAPKYLHESQESIDMAKYASEKSFIRNCLTGQTQITDDTIFVKSKVVKAYPRFIPITPELFEILGWFVAEGCVSQKSTVCFSLNLKNEMPVAERLKKLLFETFGVECKFLIEEKVHSLVVQVLSQHLNKFFLAQFGHGATNKRLPSWILSAPTDCVKSFLRAYFQGDGSIDRPTGEVSLQMSSTNLTWGLQLLLSKIGIPFTHKEGNEKGKECVIVGKISHFNENVHEISIAYPYSKILFPEYSTSRQRTIIYRKEDENNFYVPIRKLIRKVYSGTIYDITTEDNTVCTPIVSHNCRIFYNLEPYIQSILNMHALFPLSKFDIVTIVSDLTDFLKSVAFSKTFNLFKFMVRASLSWWKFGEFIAFGNKVQSGTWDDGKPRWIWKNMILLEPELVEVESSPFSDEKKWYLVTTEEMKMKANSDSDNDKKEMEQYTEEIRQLMKEGKRIPLPEDRVFLCGNLTDPSATRGTPITQCIMKVCIYQDWIRLAQSAIAKRFHYPIEFWSLGDVDKGILPDDQAIANVTALINQALQNPPFSIVFAPILKYEAFGVMGKLLPIKDDYDYIQDQILVGLGTNKNIILGEGIQFSQAGTMSLNKMIMMYQSVRDMFEDFIVECFFNPLLEWNDIQVVKGKKLVRPEVKIRWKKSLDVEREATERKEIKELWEEGAVSTQTLFDYYPHLDYQTEKERLAKEVGSIFDKGDGKRLPKASIGMTPEQLAGTPNAAPEEVNFRATEAPAESTAPIETSTPVEEQPTIPNVNPAETLPGAAPTPATTPTTPGGPTELATAPAV